MKKDMDTSQPYTILRDMIFTHPVTSEALNDLFSSITANFMNERR